MARNLLDLIFGAPTKVAIDVSDDGKTYSEVMLLELKDDQRAQDNRVHTVYIEKPHSAARYVRIRAENIATIPAGYRAAGRKAWLFVDEILVNSTPTKPRSESHP